VSNEEILEKAIQKAIASGWELPFEGQLKSVDLAMATLPGTDQQIPIIRIGIEGSVYLYFVIKDLMFNHDFARAIWSEDTLIPDAWSPIIEGKKLSKKN
jgi:hypothetical protein